MKNCIRLAQIDGNQILSMRFNNWETKINISKGANLYILVNTSKEISIIHEKDQIADKVLDFPFYGTPLLFPPNRISKGKFTANSRNCFFPLNDVRAMPNHVHGFLFYENFLG